MKRIIRETVFILLLSFLLSVVYTAASPSGMNFLKKAFRIKIEDAGSASPEREGMPEAVRK